MRSRRWTAMPETWPRIQLCGSGFGQNGSTWNRGTAGLSGMGFSCARAGDSASTAERITHTRGISWRPPWADRDYDSPRGPESWTITRLPVLVRKKSRPESSANKITPGVPMASVAIRDVRKAFGSAQVIHGVDIAIDDGQFVVLVGPSGCGKSTLLRMIAGLENITGGEIRIGERVVNNVPPKERDIAMVFQNYALYPHMTVAANMAFSLKLRSAPKAEIENRVKRAADILGLNALLARYPRQLSGGQRQRVAMGRAIVRDPQVFLFDEPLSNLDAKLRVQM